MKFLILLGLGVACSSNPGALTEKAKNMEVYPKKPTDCTAVGKVVGKDMNGSVEMATNDAMNKAAKFNASGIHVNQEVPNGKSRVVYATAYQCN